eukprot:scaffold34334_cov33-Prasinocladus_malaysianus.AAC.1
MRQLASQDWGLQVVHFLFRLISISFFQLNSTGPALIASDQPTFASARWGLVRKWAFCLACRYLMQEKSTFVFHAN